MEKIRYVLLGIVAITAIMFVAALNYSVLIADEPLKEITIGNSTFVPLSIGFSSEPKQKKLAMEAVNKFEKAHPELVVLCWNPNYLVGSMNVAVDGVFIYHRPKYK